MRVMRLLAALGLLLTAGSEIRAAGEDPEAFFEGKVRPVLAGTCVKCHGPIKPKGGRNLSSPRALARGGDCSMRVTLFSRRFDHRQPLRPVAVDVLVAASAPLVPTAAPLRLQTRCFVRPVPQLKHVGTFPLSHHRRQALKAGFDDALFVDGEGPGAAVSEGSFWNIGFWDGDQVVWPQAPALRGTSERLLQQGLAQAGIAQVVRPVTRAGLGDLLAAFATNANGVQPVASIDRIGYAAAAQDALLALLADAGGRAPWEPLVGAAG